MNKQADPSPDIFATDPLVWRGIEILFQFHYEHERDAAEWIDVGGEGGGG